MLSSIVSYSTYCCVYTFLGKQMVIMKQQQQQQTSTQYSSWPNDDDVTASDGKGAVYTLGVHFQILAYHTFFSPPGAGASPPPLNTTLVTAILLSRNRNLHVRYYFNCRDSIRGRTSSLQLCKRDWSVQTTLHCMKILRHVTSSWLLGMHQLCLLLQKCKQQKSTRDDITNALSGNQDDVTRQSIFM